VAADLERRRRHSRRVSSPTANLDINENLQSISGVSVMAPKLLPVSFTPAHVVGWSASYPYSVAPLTSLKTADSRKTTSSCQQQPETVFDSSTWPRRQDAGSLSFAAVDVDSEPASGSPCKRLHHPDGASNPQLSEEISRSDVTEPADCCKLLTLLNGYADSSSTLPTVIPPSFPVSLSRNHCCPADKVDVPQCRSSSHSAMESSAASTCVELAADEDAIIVSNLPTSGSDEIPSAAKHSGDTVPPTSNLSKAVASRLKTPSTPSKTTASPKRNKLSSGVSLLWCIHPRGSKSRSSKSGHQEGPTSLPDGEYITLVLNCPVNY